MRALLLGCALVLAVLREASGQYPEGLDTAIASAVNTSQAAKPPALNTLRRLVNAGNFKAMGFDALSDAQAATFGEALVIFRVELGDLRGFRPNNDPWAILRPPGRIFYPILVGGKPRSGIILVRERNRWRGASYGGSNGARLSSDAIRAADSILPPPPRPGARRYFWVEVLTPRTGFIGFEDTKKLMLVPLLDDRKNRWQAGVPIPAEPVFAHLAPEARDYNALPQ